ncbi:MAG TPA: C4-type zinc ribbon domain-containing protein [Vicinamibacterales bacterium]|nr:C4-type zinc ribbon domain-containing protein [Vicinamibacterales bacterium]
MNPTLAALVALQALDTAADTARRRLADLPAAEREIEATMARAQADVDACRAELAENQTARRAFDKDVAAIDTRLARFDDHKAAVKTNQEYTALLHEIAGAKAEKDAVEEQILMKLEEADAITARLKTAEAALADARRDAEAARRALAAERQTLDADLTRLDAERRGAAAGIDPPLAARYDQLLKQRRMLAVAVVHDAVCEACHVRLRPAIAQQVRRNDGIVQCDSCQRILYFEAKAAS